MARIKVAIYQYRLLHYRQQLFEDLRSRLAERNVELVLVCGGPTKREETRHDLGELAWAVHVSNWGFEMGSKDVLWQPVPEAARGAALSVVMQESRILSNYYVILRRLLGDHRLVAFWGHGRNLQSHSPRGARERWKSWWLRRVDWWFAYSESTRRHLILSGFPDSQVTVLNNSIDVSSFARDLAACSVQDIEAQRAAYGISDGAQVAIHCGSLYTDKRIEVLVEAGDLLHKRLPEFHLLVLGDGPLRPLLMQAATTRSWMHVVGAKRGISKAMHFRLADVMLNPGAVGLHVVDAFAAGTPLFTQASALHGPEFEYLKHGVNGWIDGANTSASFAAAVADTFENPAALLALRSRSAAEGQLYNLDGMVDRFADGFVSCLRFHGHQVG